MSWKSSKLGSNFYRPNEFAKEFNELQSKLLDSEGEPRYKLDIIVLSCLSISSLKKYSQLLSKFSDKETIVLVDGNCGVDLEKLIIPIFSDSCSCVLSVLCDVEGRQLSSGSYALVNDNYRFSFGVSYVVPNNAQDQTLVYNLQATQKIFEDRDSILNCMLTQLECTKVEEIIRMVPTNKNEMAVKIWEYVIPRISLNLLSIVFEQFDYDKLLENPASSLCFKTLVEELIRICYAQCGGIVVKFIDSDSKVKSRQPMDIEKVLGSINYDKILEEAKTRKRQMDEFTINEYPEFLTLSFEAYCFYHRLEYPAHVLLYQPIFLAEKYGLSYPSLNFLFAFYCRLLSISGFSIEGGYLKVSTPSLLFGRNAHLPKDDEHGMVADRCKSDDKCPENDTSNKKKNSNNNKDEFEKGITAEFSSYRSRFFPHKEAATVKTRSWFSALHRPRANSIFNSSSCTDPNVLERESSVEPCNNSPPSDKREDGKSFLFDKFESRKCNCQCHQIVKWDAGGNDKQNSQDLVDEYIKLPSFRKKEVRGRYFQQKPSKSLVPTVTAKQPVAISTFNSFEDEIRSSLFGIPSCYGTSSYQGNFQGSKEYQSFLSLREVESRKLWKMKRSYLIDAGYVSRPSTHPDQPYHDQIKLLRRINMGGILSVTTSRYGNVDSSQKIFDEWRKGSRHIGLPDKTSTESKIE